MQFDDLMPYLGEFGPYQKRLMLMVAFPQILFTMQNMVSIFILTEHDHWCNDEQIVYSSGLSPQNASSHTMSVCYTSLNDTVSNITEMVPCKSWIYSTEEHTRTPISDFNLVCDNTILKSHCNMLFYLGSTVNGVLGLAGDRFGRKRLASLSLVLFCSSIGIAWVNNIYVFMLLRFLTGFGSSIVHLKIIAVEMVGPSWRSAAGISYDLTFCVAEVLLCGLAYYIRDWTTLILAISAPGILTLSYIRLLPESVRWLQSKQRHEEVLVILKKIAEVNKRSFPEKLYLQLQDERESNLGQELVQLFKSCRLACRWMIIAFTNFVGAVLYFGLSYSAGVVGGSIYTTFLMFSVVEAAGFVACVKATDRFGRKIVHITALSTAMILSTTSVFQTLYVELESEHSWILMISASFGRMCSSTMIANLFVYTSELFPTTVRSFAVVSTNHMTVFAGALVAPYIAALGEIINSDFGPALPFVVFGLLSAAALALGFLLPETLNKELPEKINDTRKLSIKKRRNSDSKSVSTETRIWTTNRS